MTQYPSPYSPPPYQPPGYGAAYGYGTSQDLLAPARRAGILMVVVGALTIVISLCMGLAGAMFDSILAQMPSEQVQAFDQMQQQLHMPLRVFFIALAVVMLIIGVLNIVFGILVRRGGLGMIIASIILTSLMVLYFVLNTIGSFFTAGGPVGACFSVIALAIFILLLAWLIQAARAAGKIPQMQAQYQAQYQQYARTQQMYGQQGYGYGAPPPPSSPPSPASGQSPPGDPSNQQHGE